MSKKQVCSRPLFPKVPTAPPRAGSGVSDSPLRLQDPRSYPDSGSADIPAPGNLLDASSFSCPEHGTVVSYSTQSPQRNPHPLPSAPTTVVNCRHHRRPLPHHLHHRPHHQSHSFVSQKSCPHHTSLCQGSATAQWLVSLGSASTVRAILSLCLSSLKRQSLYSLSSVKITLCI